jgi:hypothetical protein
METASIPFRAFCQNEGEVVCTFGAAWHSGYSKTYTVAIAKNMAGEGWSPEGYQFCTEACCPHPITYKEMRFLADGDDESGEEEEEQEITSTNKGAKRKKVSPRAELPSKRSKTVDVSALASAVTGKEAILGFFDLDRAWRNYDLPIKKDFGSITGDIIQQVLILSSLRHRSEDKNVASKFSDVLASIRFAEVMDSYLAEPAGKSTRIEDLLRAWGQQPTKESKRWLQKELEEPRKWNKICRVNGLTPFLPFRDSTFLSSYLQMSDSEVDTFYSVLEEASHFPQLCQAGQKFQDYIREGSNIPKGIWESRAPEELKKLSINSLVKLLQ